MATSKTTFETAKRKNTKNQEDESESMNESDFEENPVPNEMMKALGKFVMHEAVDQLRDEFKQIAIEGGRQALALHDESVAALQTKLENKELKLLELKSEKVKLENDLKSQKEQIEQLENGLDIKKNKNEQLEKDLYNSQNEKNEELENELYRLKKRVVELELLVAQKESQIKSLDSEVKNINKKMNQQKEDMDQQKKDMDQQKKDMNKQKKDLEKEQASRKKKEDELLLNIKDLEVTCDRLKSVLQMKISAGNISKIEMKKLRVQIAEQEGQLKERKDKKS